MELTLRSSPYIADAIIFGAGRIQIGALILPTEIAKDCSASELAKLVAPIVALANAEAPSHSQLASEALVFLPHGTVIPRADKGSIIRPRVYKEFEGIINEVYKRLEGDIDEDGKRRLTDEADARTAIRDVIGKTVDRPIDSLEDDTDLFDFGLDSLQSSRIRNTIQRVSSNVLLIAACKLNNGAGDLPRWQEAGPQHCFRTSFHHAVRLSLHVHEAVYSLG